MISQHILIKDSSLHSGQKMAAFHFLTISFSICSLAAFHFGVFPSRHINTDVTVSLPLEDAPFYHLLLLRGDFLLGRNQCEVQVLPLG